MILVTNNQAQRKRNKLRRAAWMAKTRSLGDFWEKMKRLIKIN